MQTTEIETMSEDQVLRVIAREARVTRQAMVVACVLLAVMAIALVLWLAGAITITVSPASQTGL